MHPSPAHEDEAIRLLDRRPADDESPGDALETASPGATKPGEVVVLEVEATGIEYCRGA